MKVCVHGQGEITLTQKDYVATGGEGSVYAKGATAYKVYTDPARALPLGKIAELAPIADPNVVKPERALLDPKTHAVVGYTMRFVQNAIPLCTLFTRTYREREGLDHQAMLGLVLRLQALVRHVHEAGVLIVDLNEMNLLADRGFKEVYGIDVDRYQTASYRATAIMPSERDWKVPGHDFTELSDWFSFAILAFTMFTGIHPYKGKHPTVHGLEERMKAGISVFDPDVSVPKVTYPLDVIPGNYRAWLEAVLQGGHRLPPPAAPGAAVPLVLIARTVVGTSGLDIALVLSLQSPILGYAESGGISVAWTADGTFVGTRLVSRTTAREVGFSPKGNRPLLAWIEAGELRLFDAAGLREVPLAQRADDLMEHGGRLYIRSCDRIVEVVLTDVAGGVIASPRVAVNVLEHATRMFAGVALQNLGGVAYASVFPRAGAAHQVRVPDLEGYTVVDARCDGRVLMIVGAKGGQYDRLVYILSESYDSCALARKVEDVTPAGLNFVTLDSGVCVHLNEDEDIEISSAGSPKVRVVESPPLGNDMRLVKHQGRVAFVRGNDVSSMRLK